MRHFAKHYLNAAAGTSNARSVGLSASSLILKRPLFDHFNTLFSNTSAPWGPAARSCQTSFRSTLRPAVAASLATCYVVTCGRSSHAFRLATRANKGFCLLGSDFIPSNSPSYRGDVVGRNRPFALDSRSSRCQVLDHFSMAESGSTRPVSSLRPSEQHTARARVDPLKNAIRSGHLRG